MKIPITGVADNRSYKDEYLFQDDYYNISEEQPSIKEEPKINTTIKENPFRSNVEIEGGEIVLQPDLSALFKASGKRHSKGGMDVLLKPDSFIFSDFKDLSLNDRELELFELKEGGKSNTPAQILKKNVDIKHYNKMVNLMDDPYAADISKKSATIMLEKYIQSLGNIAYIQEQKKGFPQGLPEFSMGTAPVYDESVKDQIMENKQYMKAGGTINNPYQVGGKAPWDTFEPIKNAGLPGSFWKNQRLFRISGYSGPDPASAGYWLYGSKFPSREEAYDALLSGSSWLRSYTGPDPIGRGTWEKGVFHPSKQSSKQSTVPQNVQKQQQTAARNPLPWGLWKGDVLPLFQDRYGLTNAADKFDRLQNWDAVTKQLGYTGPKDNLSFQKWLYSSSPENKAVIDKWHQQYSKGPNQGMFDNKIGIRWASAIDEIINKDPDFKPSIPKAPTYPSPKVGSPADSIPIPSPSRTPEIDITPQGSKQADWQFTPWQKLSQLYNWGQYANVKRYMPYRSRYNATYVDPALVNPEQAIGDIRSAGNQQLSSLTTLNPILRNAQAASIAGQMINQIPGVRSQYDNQNAQILNQTRQYNNQVKNNESLVNLGFDQQYYRESIEGRKNFDNMRQFLANQATNNLFGDVETNQRLAYNLLTQDQPAYGFDWKTGNFYRNPKSILDAQSPAVNERYNDLIRMVNEISDPTERAKLMVKLEGLKTFGSAQRAPDFLQKKGGRVKKNPYRY